MSVFVFITFIFMYILKIQVKTILEVIILSKSKYTFESSPYFQSLPSNIQDTIKQSGITINSEDDLKECVKTLMKNK